MAVHDLTEGHAEWEAVQTTIRLAVEAFVEACRRQGLEPEDLTRLQAMDDDAVPSGARSKPPKAR